MMRDRTQKTICLVLLGLCLVMSGVGCGAEQATEQTDAAIPSQSDMSPQQSQEPESQSVPQNDAGPDDVLEETPSQEILSGETVAEEDLSEEELYWQGILGEFGNSRYDLTAALTEPALKEYCSDYFTLGVGINGSTLDNQTLNIPEYMAVASKHFDSCTMTNLMKSGYILDQQGSKQSADGSPVLSFATIDPTLEWCRQNGMKMRGHTLVWHVQAPDWFFREGYTDNGGYVDRETMLFRMESYIAQLMGHVQDNYPGVVYCWDVVNEAVDPDKGDPDSFFLCRTENGGVPNPWYATIGEDYVEMAFTYARKYADEDVKLFYNDFNTYQTEKRDAIYALCKSLKEKGLIDGIGMQGYWGVSSPSVGVLESTIRKFAELELEIHITELSVSVDEETEEELEKQGQRYASIFMSLEKLDTAGGGSANITNVTFFGLVDHYRQDDDTNSRLFDALYQPKPAFYKIRNMMNSVYGD